MPPDPPELVMPPAPPDAEPPDLPPEAKPPDAVMPPELAEPPELTMPEPPEIVTEPPELVTPPEPLEFVTPAEPPELVTPPEALEVMLLDPPVLPPLALVPPLGAMPPVAVTPPEADFPPDPELTAVVPPPPVFSSPDAHPKPPQAARNKVPNTAWRRETSFMKLLRWLTERSVSSVAEAGQNRSPAADFVSAPRITKKLCEPAQVSAQQIPQQEPALVRFPSIVAVARYHARLPVY
jgi:hypothetical protein